MRQQPVIAHANAEASRYPPEEYGNRKCLPGEKEKRDNGEDMKHQHEKGSAPDNRLFKSTIGGRTIGFMIAHVAGPSVGFCL